MAITNIDVIYISSRFFTEIKTKFRGDNFALNTGLIIGFKFLSERYKNLSKSTNVSTNGASKILREENITICNQ